MHPDYLPDNQRTPSASSAMSASPRPAGDDNHSAGPEQVAPMLPAAKSNEHVVDPRDRSFMSPTFSPSSIAQDGAVDVRDATESEPAFVVTKGDGTPQNDGGEAELGKGLAPPVVDSKAACGESCATPSLTTSSPHVDRQEDFVDLSETKLRATLSADGVVDVVDVSAELKADMSATVPESDSNVMDFSVVVESAVDFPADGSTDSVDVSTEQKVNTSATAVKRDSNVIDFSVIESDVEASAPLPPDVDSVDFSAKPVDASSTFSESESDIVSFSKPEPGVEALTTLPTQGDADCVQCPTESSLHASVTLPRRDGNTIIFAAAEHVQPYGECAAAELEAQASQFFPAGDASFDEGQVNFGDGLAGFDEPDVDFDVGNVDFDEGDADFDDGAADFGDFSEKQRTSQGPQHLVNGDTDSGGLPDSLPVAPTASREFVARRVADSDDLPTARPATLALSSAVEDDADDDFGDVAEAASSAAVAAPRFSAREDIVTDSVVLGPATATPLADTATAAPDHAALITSSSPGQDDDDDDFGDFTEATPQPTTTHASASRVSDDDDFGDFEEAKNFEDGAFSTSAPPLVWEAEIEKILGAWHTATNIPPLSDTPPTKRRSAESASSSASFLATLGIHGDARAILAEGLEPGAEMAPIVHQEALGTPFVWSESAIRAAYVEEVSTFLESVEFQECDDHRGDTGPGLAALSPEARHSTLTSQKALQTLPDLSVLCLSHVKQR